MDENSLAPLLFPLTLQRQSMWGERDLQKNTGPALPLRASACVSSPRSSKGNPSPCWWIKDKKHSSFLVNFLMCLFQSQLFEDFFFSFPVHLLWVSRLPRGTIYPRRPQWLCSSFPFYWVLHFILAKDQHWSRLLPAVQQLCNSRKPQWAQEAKRLY